MNLDLPHCGLYRGKAADKADGCPLFAGKQVAGAGWRRLGQESVNRSAICHRA